LHGRKDGPVIQKVERRKLKEKKSKEAGPEGFI